jgi:hypothetical protein
MKKTQTKSPNTSNGSTALVAQQLFFFFFFVSSSQLLIPGYVIATQLTSPHRTRQGYANKELA